MIMSSTHWRQIALVAGLAIAASGCSTIASLDPTGLLSDNSSSDTSPASQFPADQIPAPTASDQAAGTTPDLASIPQRPTQQTPAAQQQQTAQALANDGAQARYSADALRGGTEAAAAPPPASAGAPTAAQKLLGTSAASADAPPTAEPAPPAPQVAVNDLPPTATPAPAAAAPALPDGAQPAPPANAPVSRAAVPPSANVQTASMAPAASAAPVGPSAAAPAPASGREPAVPAVPPNTPVRGGSMMAMTQPSDASLGFKPSGAPPLSSSVNEFVSAPIIAHYRQTASNTQVASAGSAAIPAVAARGAAPDGSSVMTNMAAVSGAPAAIAAMNGGISPTAVIYFPGDGTSLSTAARAEVRSAAAAFKANGGQGTIRVVGHASSRTANMPVEKHLETIFDKSQARANAVAQELIHEGVPASRVLIDAVGDSQPVYYESMPQGEEGNRRAEIFVQG